MIKTIIKSLPQDIQNTSSKIKYNKILKSDEWRVVTDDGTNLSLIFKNNNELFISNNGDVVTAKWEIIANNNSLVITEDGIGAMFRPFYIDGNAFILKKAGEEGLLFLVRESFVENMRRMSDEQVIEYLRAKDKGTRKTPTNDNKEKKDHSRNTIADKIYDCWLEEGLVICWCIPIPFLCFCDSTHSMIVQARSGNFGSLMLILIVALGIGTLLFAVLSFILRFFLKMINK